MVGSRRIDLPSWDNYIRAPVAQQVFQACRATCGPALADQRRRIESLIEKLKPRRIACLGAGYLNDIPLDKLIRPELETYLIDFVPDICVEGVRGNIIEKNEKGCSCLFCHTEKPQEFCQGFSIPILENEFVCEAFHESQEGDVLRCKNYVPGASPGLIVHDVTAGRASQFARQICRSMHDYHTPEQAFRRALSECKRCVTVHEAIPLPDDSLDLVTSSMLISQFEHEPYTYFARLLELKFGSEAILRKANALNTIMESLRTELFITQMEGHAEELYRLVNKQRGKVYLSVELFRSVPQSKQYFLVQGTTQAMDILGRFFFFDFEMTSPEEVLCSSKIGSGTSIIESFVLTPRSDVN